MNQMQVELGDRSYPIYIDSGILENTGLLRSHIRGSQALVVSNETVAPLYLDKLLRGLDGLSVDTVILPDGERFKTLDVLNRIFDRLLEYRHNRTTTLIALGGGVVGDMTGFAAACYQRGVDFIQVPTTLLAQVDSSVGGKTGINHPLGKNMIGAFHQPNAVLIDVETLTTLPDRELKAGLAEVIKYGLIADPGFLEWLEDNLDRLLAREFGALVYAIERSCRNKAHVVARDETEQGVRAILNLGHTFGHAIETAQGYTDWLHGEAVAAGMAMAADLSVRQGWLAAENLERILKLVRRCGLPVKAPREIPVDQFLELMSVDKKARNGEIRLVLLKSLGQPVVVSDYDRPLLLETLEHCRG